jgi:hypothetical protein
MTIGGVWPATVTRERAWVAGPAWRASTAAGLAEGAAAFSEGEPVENAVTANKQEITTPLALRGEGKNRIFYSWFVLFPMNRAPGALALSPILKDVPESLSKTGKSCHKGGRK